MAVNPQVPQGTLNRLRGSVTVSDFPELNITAPYVGRPGVRISFQGQASQRLPTMAGSVISEEPVQEVVVTVSLIKAQTLSQLWETRRQTDSALGNIVVKTDSATLNDYDVYNASIINVGELSFNGETEAYPVTIGGYIIINNNMWNLV